MRDRGRALTWIDAAIAVGLGVLYVVILVKSVGTLGYARDEGFYFHAAASYGRWLEQLWASPGAAIDRKVVDAAWANNHEHPALIKTLFALSKLDLDRILSLVARSPLDFLSRAVATRHFLLRGEAREVFSAALWWEPGIFA